MLSTREHRTSSVPSWSSSLSASLLSTFGSIFTGTLGKGRKSWCRKGRLYGWWHADKIREGSHSPLHSSPASDAGKCCSSATSLGICIAT